MANTVQTQSSATFLDIIEVSEWLQFPTPPTGSQAAMLQRVIDMACSWCTTYLNRPIAPTQYFERHDGWSGDTIMLRHYPFVQLINAIEWQSSGGPVQLLESTPANPIDGIQINYATSQLTRTFAGYSWPRPFFPGSRNVEIVYLAGFSPIPPEIWIGAAELVGYWWKNTQQASRTIQRASEYDQVQETSNDGLWEGVPYRITGLLDQYKKIAIG